MWKHLTRELSHRGEVCLVLGFLYHNFLFYFWNPNSPLVSGLLQPLPIPSRPWSDISVDFVTGLPVSQGNTTVLTVVDRFSKMARFIALPKLPSAKETAEIMMNNVFKVHGFPKDIVSDRGPQFVSRFWREFCRLIGAKASLTSG